MNQHLQNIIDLIQNSQHLTEKEKGVLIKSAKNADKELEIANFKLQRTEKVKHTTAVLLDETIVELEEKRKILEAKNKELEIETALEKVRTVAMGMKQADDMLDICKTISHELQKLGVQEIRNVQTAIIYPDKGSYMNYEYYAKHDNTLATEVLYNNHELSNAFIEKMLQGPNEFFFKSLFGKEVQDWYEFQKTTNQFVDSFLATATSLNYYWFSLGPVALGVSTYDPLSKEQQDLFVRFRNVFELSYRRYLDIEKAIAQTREAEIELALERVRARTMAMQNSEELSDISLELFKQIQSLGVATWHCAFNIYDDADDSSIEWSTNASGIFPKYRTPRIGIFRRYYEIGQTGQSLHIETIGEDRCAEHYDFLCTLPSVGEELIKLRNAGIAFPTSQIDHVAYFKFGYLLFITYKPAPEAHDIFKRFAKAFEQTYTRFLDLQKAEAQAREAQIEASLERVRSKTMAMHNSQDVGETATVMVDELQRLGIETIRCGIGIMHEPGDMEVWTISTDENKKTSIIIGWLDMNMHPLLFGAFDTWRQKKGYHSYELKGADMLNYYTAINNYPGYPIRYDTNSLPERIFHNEFHFNEGTLFSFALHDLTEEQKKIFKRFASVFGQTYRRYLDLQKAEAQAKEAQIETALERVRSRTLAMQKSEELAETAAVLFQQLIGLGIEPNRLYIGIVNEEKDDAEFWLTEEDGTKVSRAFTTDLVTNISLAKMYEGWKQQQKSLIIDMQGEELQSYFSHLTRLGVPFKDGLKQKRRIQEIAYFSKGFIGMASPDEQSAETLNLLERFAAVFNLTFTRFNDLKIAEAHAHQAEEDLIAIKEAKQKAEEALTELQATQKQLIQSEKMASLGELTAGIAHEIQNPLNFVNNFSEVSKELLDEMKIAIDKGDTDEAKEIASDVIQNLEKINHHGKRADSIVKGMLQHSRTSSGQKELTDINALTDEYLRLAYHGLRAKDKNFNATLKTEYSDSIGKASIIPQDMGRVILNLITNAFYTVNEKKKSGDSKYEPIVSVRTIKDRNNILISVSDNGNGIPQRVLDKIFQPFFTTKPTGQGTGLGLSLAYDIVKAHGGELKVNTKEGEGSEFIIQLPYAL